MSSSHYSHSQKSRKISQFIKIIGVLSSIGSENPGKTSGFQDFFSPKLLNL